MSRRTPPFWIGRGVLWESIQPKIISSTRPSVISVRSPLTSDQVRLLPTIDVVFTAKYAYRNVQIIRRIQLCLRSLLLMTNSSIHFHVILDIPSIKRVERALKKITYITKKQFKVSYLDADVISLNHREVIEVMRKYFFTKDVGRYNDDIFFISEIFHRVLPFEKVIMIDLDLKFKADILDLYRHFEKFNDTHLMAISNDLQPQYMVDFGEYRELHPGTNVGSPRPGKQGFNTGIVLFHLDRMRNSILYNKLLQSDVLGSLCSKYYFKGYLGHQDFFTLTGMEYPKLYYTLDCTWNRQLDTAWIKNVNKSVFDLYHECAGTVKIYHGNGNSQIPFT
ncbi:xyloside xylosyltransferase 1-like [Tachypleus tridentatus]|uniref:xyloside xylosyltransferase 1-like n=1 Tax=Tachypleus tridentatus TaxID=6853 RepID=UPI003FD50A97